MKRSRSFVLLLFLLVPILIRADPGEFSIPRLVPLSDSQREALAALVGVNEEAAALFAALSEEALAKVDLEPTALRVIHYEGLVNTDPKRIASVESLRQLSDAAVLFGYWQASGDPAAAKSLRRLIVAWAEVYEPTGNDVNENKLYPLFIAYEGLRSEFAAADRERVDDWIGRLGVDHAARVEHSDYLSNRYTKSVRLVAVFGRILGRADWIRLAESGFERFVTGSLRADGTSYDLEHRDSLTYHTSGLRPLIEIAMLAGDRGDSLYYWKAPSGSSLARSVTYVVPFADRSETREEWRNTKVHLDRERAAAGIEKYRAGRLYDPVDALPLLEEASLFDEGLLPLVHELYGSGVDRFASWTMVVNEVIRQGDR